MHCNVAVGRVLRRLHWHRGRSTMFGSSIIIHFEFFENGNFSWDDKPACMQKNILATALNTGGGKWIGHQPIFQIFATFPNIEKVQDKPACNPERHTAKANKAKVESES